MEIRGGRLAFMLEAIKIIHRGRGSISKLGRAAAVLTVRMTEDTTSKRKFAPKGRGGCSTCKLRHIRCDEQKPSCTPCIKSRRQCEYSADSVRPNPEQLKVVLWQPDNLGLHRLSTDPGQTSDEVRAFDFFRSKVAKGLDGFFDEGFWSHHVLQAAQHEPSIRHAIVALASLSETMLKTRPDTAKVPGSPEAFAIRQHNKAITDLHQKMQDSNRPPSEVVLMTCALFICFEMFQNHYESALRQMSSGIYVFFDWHTKQRRGRQTASIHSFGTSSELSNQLSQIFGRLMLQTVLFIDTHLLDFRWLAPAFTPDLPSIPSTFKSIIEARDCLNSSLCSIFHEGLASQIQGSEISEIHRSPTGLLSNGPIHEWSLSFKSFMTDQKARLSYREQQGAIVLEINQISGSIVVAVGAYGEEAMFDSFENSFSQIVALASRLSINISQPCQDHEPSYPAFDMGVMASLYYVASRCRHPSIRRQGLHLLRNGPPQEGIWNSVMLSNIAERIMAIEEMDYPGARNSADIPATARLSVLNATIHSAERRVEVHCCRQQFDEGGKAQVLHEWVEY